MISLKLAFRALFRYPFVTTVAILSLALGIGANAAIFSLFDQLLLRPLPVAEPDGLVNFSSPGPKTGYQSSGDAGGSDNIFSYPMFRDLQRAHTPFTGIAGHRAISANLAYRGRTSSGEGLLVSGSYFPVLGLQAVLGRLLGQDDDRVVGEARVVVLSHAYWQSHLGQRPDVLNDTLIVNGHAMTIVGVAPRGFEGTTLGSHPHVFIPVTMRWLMQPTRGSRDPENRNDYWLYLFARLRPDVAIEQARIAINMPYQTLVRDVEAPLQSGMSDQMLERFKAKQIDLSAGSRGQSDWRRDVRAPLTMLLGVSGLVLLIACANIANLLLARTVARGSEMAVRLSIGASRSRLIVQLLAESCLLATFGGLTALLVAPWTLHLIQALLPAGQAATIPVQLDMRMLAFAAALTLGTGLLFGLFPALHSTRIDLLSTLKGQAGQPSGSHGAARFRTSLVTAQIALSMTLLVLAGLFTKSLFNVSRVDLGQDIDQLVAFDISPELNGYSPERSRNLFERLEEELAALPGVTSVTASTVRLLSYSESFTNVSVEGFLARPDANTDSRRNRVGAGYFRTLRIPLIAGREFTPADTQHSPKVAIVNQAFAHKFGLGTDAVGRRMKVGAGGPLDIEIVGLVQDAKYSEVKGEPPPQFFLPYRQDEELGAITFYLRTALDPEQLLPTIPRAVAQLDPHLPVEHPRTMTEQVRDNVFVDWFISVLSAAFAMLATLLAAIGLYGVLAYTVAQRTRELGLRMALGAAPSRVRGLVLRQVVLMIIGGGTIGLGGAVALGRAAEALLFDLEGHDPLVLMVATVALTIVALGAGLLPAHRASRIDPMQALRFE